MDSIEGFAPQMIPKALNFKLRFRLWKTKS